MEGSGSHPNPGNAAFYFLERNLILRLQPTWHATVEVIFPTYHEAVWNIPIDAADVCGLLPLECNLVILPEQLESSRVLIFRKKPWNWSRISGTRSSQAMQALRMWPEGRAIAAVQEGVEI